MTDSVEQVVERCAEVVRRIVAERHAKYEAVTWCSEDIISQQIAVADVLRHLQPGDPLPGGLVVAREKLTDAAKAKLGGWGPNLDDMWAAMIEASHD